MGGSVTFYDLYDFVCLQGAVARQEVRKVIALLCDLRLFSRCRSRGAVRFYLDEPGSFPADLDGHLRLAGTCILAELPVVVAFIFTELPHRAPSVVMGVLSQRRRVVYRLCLRCGCRLICRFHLALFFRQIW